MPRGEFAGFPARPEGVGRRVWLLGRARPDRCSLEPVVAPRERDPLVAEQAIDDTVERPVRGVGRRLGQSLPDQCIRIGGEDCFVDRDGLASQRYDAAPGATYLLRPDGYVAARFRQPSRPVLEAALARACALN